MDSEDNKKQKLIKIGDVVLTEDALELLKELQAENNTGIEQFCLIILKIVNANGLLMGNYGPEEFLKECERNIRVLSMYYYDIKKLSKPYNL